MFLSIWFKKKKKKKIIHSVIKKPRNILAINLDLYVLWKDVIFFKFIFNICNIFLQIVFKYISGVSVIVSAYI